MDNIFFGFREEAPDRPNEPGDRSEPASDIDTRKVTVTFFKDEFARDMRPAELTLRQLAEHIRYQTAASKAALPLLKLAIFGSKRSEKNCLRTNENTEQIDGIEGEHDAGTMTFDEAVAIMRSRHPLRRLHLAVLYSRREGTLAGAGSTSKRHPTETRAGFVARINGLFGGTLTRESFVLSQSFYYGSVDDNPHHRVEVIDGDFLNLRDDTYAGSIFKDGSKVGDKTDSEADNVIHLNRPRDDNPESAPLDKIEAALDAFSSNCSRMEWVKVAAGLLRELGEGGFDLFDRWSAKAVGNANDGTPMYSPDKTRACWRGVHSMTDVTIASLFYLADQADPTWRTRYDDQQPTADVEPMLKKMRAEMKARPEEDDDADPGLAETPAARVARGGVTLSDFYAFMPRHSYIFAPTGEIWVSSSVNSRLPRIPMKKKNGEAVLDENNKPKHHKPTDWLDKRKPVEQMTWSPGCRRW